MAGGSNSPNNQGGGGRAGGQRTGGANNGGFGGNIGQLGESNFQGGPRTLEGMNPLDPQSAPPTQAQAETAYSDLMRDLQRLRGSIADDKDMAREYQQLVQQAQGLDPKRWGSSPQLAEVINGQVLTAIDQIELLLRRKMDANDGSVRSASPDKIPPGYADAVAEYRRRLSKQ